MAEAEEEIPIGQLRARLRRICDGLRSARAMIKKPETFKAGTTKFFEIGDELVKLNATRFELFWANATSPMVEAILKCLPVAPVEEYAQFFDDCLKRYFKYYSKKQRKNIKDAMTIAQHYDEHLERNREKIQKKTEELMENTPDRLSRAEFVLKHRTRKLILVLDRCCDGRNQAAMLRTAELFGVQDVWCIRNILEKNSLRVTKKATLWLSIRSFDHVDDCVKALKEEGYTIWVSDVGRDATCLDSEFFNKEVALPEKVALVMGREADGPHELFLKNADDLLYLPQYGFIESFNVGIACAQVLQYLFLKFPQLRDNGIPKEDLQELRKEWYGKLANSSQQSASFEQYLENPPEPMENIRREKACVIPPKLMKKMEQLEQKKIDQKNNGIGKVNRTTKKYKDLRPPGSLQSTI